MVNRSLVEVIRLLFIVLFIYAAVNKLSDVDKFVVQMGQSPLLTPFAPYFVWLIPVIEIAVSISLAIRKFIRIGLYASVALMGLFTAYIIAIIKFSEYIPCSCGGILSKMSWREHLIFNLCFLIIGMVGVLLIDGGNVDPRRDYTSKPNVY
jgi:uncharacterized membrane protein YphA (DoxX/SURF4 family)